MPPLKERKDVQRELVGTDIFVYAKDKDVGVLASEVQPLVREGFHLSMISNRGVKMWPGQKPESLCSEMWRLRFRGKTGPRRVAQQITDLADAGFDIVKTHNLYEFDGEPAYSKAQGE